MATADVWRTITMCPVCQGTPHLVADSRVVRSGFPHARISAHPDGWGGACIMSRRWAPVWDEPSTRAACKGRSMGVCEYCRERPADEMHHRISRGVGGKWHPANIIHLCWLCHAFCDGNTRAEAVQVGLVLQRADNPEWIPVRTPFGELWLTDAVTGELVEPRKRRKTSRAHGVGRRKGTR